MANFIAVVDPDTERRSSFIKQIKSALCPVEGLGTNGCQSGNLSIVWSANVDAPVSYVADDKGTAVLWGQAISQSDCTRIDALHLRKLWTRHRCYSDTAFDGFYAGMVYRQNYGLLAGADLLGIFPVYYWARGEVLLAGSSPELFRHHPDFKVRLNPAGLVGVLLTMHIFDGQTLLADVHRLGAGNLLLWREGKGASEVPQYRIKLSEKYFNLPFSAQVDILAEAIGETIGRHVSAENKHSLLLSGGLDSRMLAGYLDENNIQTAAITFGIPADLEMQAAVRVARKLRLRHCAVEVGFDQYPDCAKLQARWEHVGNGFNFITNWAVPSRLKEFAPRVILGHVIDAVVGTRYITWAYSACSRSMSFESYFANINKWAIEPAVLKRLLRPEVFADLVDETIARIEKVYHSYCELESQRAWCFNLYNRQRFYVGGAAWAISFGAWPVMPALDRRLLETAAGMPAATIAERRAQTELVCRRFPALAALPLDRNSYDTRPLRPRLRYQLRRYVFDHLNRVCGLGQQPEKSNHERRYYFRIFDFNNAGWCAVRRQAEDGREALFELFDRRALNEILPGPDMPLHFEDPIVGPSGLKSLLAFMLWSKEHL